MTISIARSCMAMREKAAGVLKYASAAPEWVLHSVPIELKGRQLEKVISVIRPDGAINPSSACAKLLECPIVMLDGRWSDIEYNALFTCRDNDIAKVAVDHLVQRGFTQCAYVGFASQQEAAHSDARFRAFSRELRRRRLACDVPRIDYDPLYYTYERSPTRLVEWLMKLPKPCGVFVYNDDACQYVMAACRAARLRIPEQIGIIGVDNETDICENSQPTLTSIEPDFIGAGLSAAKQLDSMMRRGVPKKPVVCHYGVKKLHVRLSTQSVIVPMKFAGAVMERIRLSEGRDISVAQLAREFGVSRRMLEYRFKMGQGRSIREEIMDTRLSVVERFLTTTTMPLKNIAFETGFGTETNLRIAFRKYRNATLRQYRLDHSPR